MARPIPLVPPVINIRFPANEKRFFIVFLK